MTILSAQAAGAAGAISRRWYQRHPNNWIVALGDVRAHGASLLEAIDARYRSIRDDVAREAFDRQLTIAEVARERLRRGHRDLCTLSPGPAIPVGALVYWK